jgi:RNA polymerase sigma factor (sigma-70 family)
MDQAEAVAELVEGARQGDQRSWDELVERFLPLVSAIVARHRLRGHDADDVNQTVWLSLVEHLGDLREPRALPGWISTTTRHECLRVIKGSRRTVLVDPQSASVLDPPDEERDVADGVLALERQQVLRAGLAELPDDRREMLTLLLADPPLPYREVSRLLGIPVGSIGPTRARALDQLRNSNALRGFLAEAPRGSEEMSR